MCTHSDFDIRQTTTANDRNQPEGYEDCADDLRGHDWDIYDDGID